MQQEIASVTPSYKGVFPGSKSAQWKLDSANANPKFSSNSHLARQNDKPELCMTAFIKIGETLSIYMF